MIQSFRCKETLRIFHTRHYSKKWSHAVQKIALRKLWLIEAAMFLNDLKVPPGNHLKALRGKRKGQYSIRINDQYRICFQWSGSDAFDVELVDYH